MGFSGNAVLVNAGGRCRVWKRGVDNFLEAKSPVIMRVLGV